MRVKEGVFGSGGIGPDFWERWEGFGGIGPDFGKMGPDRGWGYIHHLPILGLLPLDSVALVP